MNFNTDNKPLIEAAILASMTTVFVIMSLYIPILTILIFILPVAFIILGVKYPIKYGIMSLVVVCLLAGFLTEIVYTVFIFIVFGPIAIVMGYLMGKSRKEFDVIIGGTIASALSWFLAIYLIGLISGVDVIDQTATMFREAFYNQTEMLSQMNLSEVRLNETINYFISIFPALIIIQAMIVAVINYYLSISILKRSNFYKGKIPSFSSFKLPKNIIIGFFLLVLLAYLTQFIEGIYYQNLISNISTIFFFLLFLQGVAVLLYFMEKWKINKLIKVIIITVLILMGTLVTFIAIAGFIDAVFNIRKFESKE